jgi:hypothetical protein
MSHLVTIATKVRDATAISAACQRLNLAAPVQGTAKLYSGEATGLIVQLPDWRYPIVIDTTSGTIQFDHYSGHWGNPECLDRFLQAYAVEVVRLEARKQGHTVTEIQLQDGSIRLQLQEGS